MKQENMTFKQVSDTEVEILKGEKLVGVIHIPTSLETNQVPGFMQICGFSELIDYWACGIYKGYKDVGLIFGDTKLKGEFSSSIHGCIRCYHVPCQCETKSPESPFKVKRLREVVAEKL